jgi:cell division protein FtsZ
MSLKLSVPQQQAQLKPRITVVGVGGAGGNAVNNMIQSNLEGVEFVVTNTDAQALEGSVCDRRLQLGRNITAGLGAGSRPDVGRAAAEEAMDDLLEALEGSNMVFITAGLGGGTGTGASPVIARAARESGILTVGVVTKPFHFEGVHRMRIAETGMQELQQFVDTLIVIPNQNLFRVANEKTTFADAFKMADDVLHSGVRGVTDLMVMPGLINLDFADIRAVMSEMGKAMMGTGEAEGEGRAIASAEAAISNPLLDDVSMKGARGVLINVTGGMDMTLFEVDEAANRIRDEVDPEANIIFGSTFDESLNGRMRISVVATGIEADECERPKPVPLSVVAGGSLTARKADKPAGDVAMASTAQAQSESETLATTFEAEATPQAEPEFAETETLGEEQEELAASNEVEAMAEAEQAEAEETVAAEATSDSVTEDEAMLPETDQEEEVFVAPQPVRPAVKPAIVSPPRAAEPSQGDPFAEAAMANGGRQAEGTASSRSRAQNLFARVTGAARALHASASGETTEEPVPQTRKEPSAGVVAREPAEASVQPRLTGLDTKDRPSNSQQDDDLLDIPAFLRRQAN